jgi:hypothetical protein
MHLCDQVRLSSLVVHELSRHEQRLRVSEVFVAALLFGVLGWLEAVIAERQRHRLTEVFDRTDLFEDFFKA